MGLGRLPWFERVTLGASGLTLALALSAWGLMRFGAFSLGRVLAVVAVLAIGLGGLAWRRRRRTPSDPPPREPRHAFVALALCAAFGVLYAWYPTYFLLGGQDPGPYLAFAARIAKTGGLNLEVLQITEWARAHPGMIRGFPAVYGNLADPHGSEPLQAQFLHLFTAYDAISFALGRVEGAVRANAWLAVLCLATGFTLVRRLASPLAAFVLLIALGVNPAFVWASRITLTEMLALWLNLSGLLLLTLAWDFGAVVVGALAGVAFGLGVLNRLDGGLGSLAVLGFGVASLLGEPGHRRVAAAAALGHFVTSAFAYHDAYQLSPVYCHSLAAGSSSVTALPIVTSALDALALACALLPARLGRAFCVNETTLRFGGYAAVWCGVFWLLFGLLFRPLLEHTEEARSLRELTWYVGWATWPLVALGLGLAMRGRTFRRWLPLVTFALGTLVIYTARTEVAPVHIWASRRWVPHVIPLALVLGSTAAVWLVGGLRSRFVAPAVLAVICLEPTWRLGRLFLFESMLAGLSESYDQVARHARGHSDRWPLVTDRVNYASILSYIYDTPTLVLNERGLAAFERGELEGKLGIGFTAFDLRSPVEVAIGYEGLYLEPSHGHRPTTLVDSRMPLHLGKIGGRAFVVEVPAADVSLRSQVSRIGRDGSVTSIGKRGQLLFGPWVSLDAGRYRVEWHGRVESAGRKKRHGTVDVIIDSGKTTIVEAPLVLQRDDGERTLGALDFTLERRLEGVEFRLRIEPRIRVTLTKLRLERFEEP